MGIILNAARFLITLVNETISYLSTLATACILWWFMYYVFLSVSNVYFFDLGIRCYVLLPLASTAHFETVKCQYTFKITKIAQGKKLSWTLSILRCKLSLILGKTSLLQNPWHIDSKKFSREASYHQGTISQVTVTHLVTQLLN